MEEYYGEERRSSLSSILFGILLFLGSFVLLFWNEGNYASNITKAKFIEKNVISVNSLQPENNGKLVHYTAKASTDEFVGDSILKARVLVLDRDAEMYQWKKKRKKTGSRRYTYYTKDWDSSLQHNSRNPDTMPVKSQRFYPQNVTMGDFTLSNGVISKLRANVSYSNLPNIDNGYNISGNYYYSGMNLNNPEIGDIRISYKYLPINSTISVIARQLGNSLQVQMTNSGDIALVENGDSSAAQMIEHFKTYNSTFVLMLRLLGFIMMFGGIMTALEPISNILSYIGLGWLFDLVSGVAAFIISVVLSGITIAIAWVFYRPAVSISIVAVVTIIMLLARKKSNKKIATREYTQPAAQPEPKDQLEKELDDLMK